MLNSKPFGHPMHLHGQQISVLALGKGTQWNGKITNPQDPQRRDTQLVPVTGYFMIQLEGNNPGLWRLHCHISWYLSAGMWVNLVLGKKELGTMEVLQSVGEMCRGGLAICTSMYSFANSL